MPLIGIIFILLVRGDPEIVARNVRAVAVWASLITFSVSLFLWFYFDTTSAEFQFVEQRLWIPSLGISYYLGVDGISLLFITLTTFLSLICIVASWETITARLKEYMIAFLFLETMMIGVFCALDGILFYLFWEAMLIPMFLIMVVMVFVLIVFPELATWLPDNIRKGPGG